MCLCIFTFTLEATTLNFYIENILSARRVRFAIRITLSSCIKNVVSSLFEL